MKYMKKLFVILMVLGLCGTAAACSSETPDTKNDSAQTETAAENNKDEGKPDTEAGTEENDAVIKANIGIIASSMDRAVTNEFIKDVQTALSEQYPDQIDEIFVMDSYGDKAILSDLIQGCRARWDGDHNAVLLVNDEVKGFIDEEILTLLEEAEGLGLFVGVDHAIDGAPESAFVYDASDAAGCASLLMENALR